MTAWSSTTDSWQAGQPAAVSGSATATALPPGSLPAGVDVGQRAIRADRGTRGQVRPTLTEATEKTEIAKAARAKAAKEKAAKEKAAKQKAAKEKAAKEKAARQRAAKEKAARQRAAEEKAARQQAAKRAAQLNLTVVGSRYTTAALKLRTEPSKGSRSVDVIDEAKKLKITQTVRQGYRLVVVQGKGRWVTEEYLSSKKPSSKSSSSSSSKSSSSSGARISSGSCSKSRGIESGLVPNAVKVYRAICASFPEVSSYGGRRGSNDFHGSGRAVDAMISDSGAGRRLANWVRANASRLGVSEVIYAQKIWTVQRAGEGWRSMSDRGSATANHYDHVHVSVY
ncbi:MAG: hypothetical protein L0H24_02685 [Microlunatus sp.]|nr:hypothetical protein [Microlunatus sp.]